MDLSENTIVTPLITEKKVAITPSLVSKYSVEFFHIYTDEKIGPVHRASINYLRDARKAWKFEPELIVMIDDYNPKVHVTDSKAVLSYLKRRGISPNYWAYEGDMVANAQVLLANMTSRRLQKNYLRYIENHGKYPCSLLTATWYLTRLGLLDHQVIRSNTGVAYTPSARLINILPEDYKSVESRAREIIENSIYALHADKIQDLFYPVSTGRAVSLW
jgi:hypothetical protein